MGEDKIQELLLQLVQDMSYVKAKLSNIEEQKLSSRIDHLEAQNREHDKTIKSLERRNDTMEEFVRGTINDTKKTTNKCVYIYGISRIQRPINHTNQLIIEGSHRILYLYFTKRM